MKRAQSLLLWWLFSGCVSDQAPDGPKASTDLEVGDSGADAAACTPLQGSDAITCPERCMPILGAPVYADRACADPVTRVVAGCMPENSINSGAYSCYTRAGTMIVTGAIYEELLEQGWERCEGEAPAYCGDDSD